MDAYSSYIIQTSNARLTDLRREAAEYALSRAARGTRGSWWSRVRGGLRHRPVAAAAAAVPVITVPLTVSDASDEPLRRTA